VESSISCCSTIEFSTDATTRVQDTAAAAGLATARSSDVPARGSSTAAPSHRPGPDAGTGGERTPRPAARRDRIRQGMDRVAGPITVDEHVHRLPFVPHVYRVPPVARQTGRTDSTRMPSRRYCTPSAGPQHAPHHAVPTWISIRAHRHRGNHLGPQATTSLRSTSGPATSALRTSANVHGHGVRRSMHFSGRHRDMKLLSKKS
jgi:hypothetical protein